MKRFNIAMPQFRRSRSTKEKLADIKRKRRMQAIAFEILHRKRWIAKPVKTKRYIRGVISRQIEEAIHSRRKGAQITTDPAVRSAALRKTGGKCYLCWRSYTLNEELARRLPHLFFNKLEIDHIVPFSKMGSNSISNYMPVCQRCNNRKSNLSLAEFRAGKRKPYHQSKNKAKPY